jgi:hypothetical protein
MGGKMAERRKFKQDKISEIRNVDKDKGSNNGNNDLKAKAKKLKIKGEKLKRFDAGEEGGKGDNGEDKGKLDIKNSKKPSESDDIKPDDFSLEELVGETGENDSQGASHPGISLNIGGAKAPVLEKATESEFDIRRFFPVSRIGNPETEGEKPQENLYFSAQDNYASNTARDDKGISYMDSQGIFLTEEDKTHRDTRRIFRGNVVDYRVGIGTDKDRFEKVIGPERSEEQERTRKYMAKGEERN